MRKFFDNLELMIKLKPSQPEGTKSGPQVIALRGTKMSMVDNKTVIIKSYFILGLQYNSSPSHINYIEDDVLKNCMKEIKLNKVMKENASYNIKVVTLLTDFCEALDVRRFMKECNPFDFNENKLKINYKQGDISDNIEIKFGGCDSQFYMKLPYSVNYHYQNLPFW